MSLGETFTAGNTTYVDFGDSREGDCDGNDYITLADLSAMNTGWNTGSGDPGYNICYDLNRDGWITLADLSTMNTNWAQAGDLAGY